MEKEQENGNTTQAVREPASGKQRGKAAEALRSATPYIRIGIAVAVLVLIVLTNLLSFAGAHGSASLSSFGELITISETQNLTVFAFLFGGEYGIVNFFVYAAQESSPAVFLFEQIWLMILGIATICATLTLAVIGLCRLGNAIRNKKALNLTKFAVYATAVSAMAQIAISAIRCPLVNYSLTNQYLGLTYASGTGSFVGIVVSVVLLLVGGCFGFAAREASKRDVRAMAASVVYFLLTLVAVVVLACFDFTVPSAMTLAAESDMSSLCTAMTVLSMILATAIAVLASLRMAGCVSKFNGGKWGGMNLPVDILLVASSALMLVCMIVLSAFCTPETPFGNPYVGTVLGLSAALTAATVVALVVARVSGAKAKRAENLG